MRRPFATLLLLSAATLAAPRAQVPVRPSPPPRLAVLLVVDQFRADYIPRYGDQWSKGLRRLLDTGASFPLAAYPYALTVTCAGHATISTGTLPSTHGMVGNSWHDRALRKNVACTEDHSVTSVGFGGRAGTERHGSSYLAVNTLADELRSQAVRSPTVVGLSLKARSAITLAGRRSPTTYAVWEEDDGTWASSSDYTAAIWPEVDAWARANPVRAAYGQVWERVLPAGRYRFSDDQPGEPAPRAFPHVLTSKAGIPDDEFVNLWERSPLSDVALGSLAQHLVRTLKLGQSAEGTDVLAVSFSALDLVGHAFGPRSHEVQDTLVRLDATIGALLDDLDRVVGRDHYVVALSADHGVAPMPEQVEGVLRSAGRATWNDVRLAVEDTLAPILGEGPHVTTIVGANVYLTPGTLARVLATPGARQAVTRAIAAVPGAGQVYWADELASPDSTDDEGLRLARHSYFAGRSGDLMVFYDVNWVAQATGTTHGTPHAYDRRVPVIFAGAGITAGRYWSPASPADVAPTLAHLMGITLAQAQGRVLGEILR